MPKIDIHNSIHYKETALEKFKGNEKISDSQKKNLIRFVEECEIGKNGKKVGAGRLATYIGNLKRLYFYFRKDLDKITEQDAVKFYKNLETDRFKTKKGRALKPSAKNEFIKIFKKYLRWCWDEQKYKTIAGWIKKYGDMTELSAISLDEAEKMVRGVDNPRDKAIIMFLFDSGCRIQEALNVTIKDIEKKQKQGEKGFYYLVDIKYSKTLPRKISIPLATKYITEWLKSHPERNNLEVQLFPLTYNAVSMMVERLSEKVLGKRITCHILRHSSATHYSKRMKPYPFCYRYGWTIGSNMARRYIDRNLLGEEEQEKLVNIIEDEKIQKLEAEIEMIKQHYKKLIQDYDKISKFFKKEINRVKRLKEGKNSNLVGK